MDELVKNNNQLVSVVMAVYKEPEKYLVESIESILNQSYKNIQFVIILDNPKNIKAKKIIENYALLDNRIVLINNEENLGLALSLNKGIALSDGELVARMDADDISFPERIEQQVNYLLKHPEVDILGTDVININDDGADIRLMKSPVIQESNALKILQYRTICFHPTWMVRRCVYSELHFYNPLLAAQDYDFLYRAVIRGFIVKNIKNPLLKYRISSENISSKKSLIQLKSKFYVKIYNRRDGVFSRNEYLNYIKTKKIATVLHGYSNRLFVSSMIDEKPFSKVVKLFASCLLSPYQAKNIFHQVLFKLFFRS
jgi:hypothetical protein